MSRTDTFRMRVTTAERQLITAIAQRFGRNESDAVRLVLQEKALALGVSTPTPEHAPSASAKDSGALAASAAGT